MRACNDASRLLLRSQQARKVVRRYRVYPSGQAHERNVARGCYASITERYPSQERRGFSGASFNSLVPIANVSASERFAHYRRFLERGLFVEYTAARAPKGFIIGTGQGASGCTNLEAGDFVLCVWHQRYLRMVNA